MQQAVGALGHGGTGVDQLHRWHLANRGPVRLSQVENEQKAILLIVRRLAETGEMVIGSGDDTYV